MSARTKFNFALNILTISARRLQDALADPAYHAAMTERLTEDFAADFDQKIRAVPGALGKKGEKIVEVSDLTDDQAEAFQEVERLTAGARRTAKLAFPGDSTRLRTEFQVGIDTPKTLSAELERAGIVLASTKKYATELRAKSWVAADTTALETALGQLTSVDLEQESAMDDRLKLTGDKATAANALYDACLTIQNAARLQFPAKKDAAGNAVNATPRARFLLEEFPPRDRSEPDGGTQGGGTPPPAA